MGRIHILHENSEWTEPLIEALERRRLPYQDWYLDEGIVDLKTEPPDGIFYNRMSASSHTREHRYSPELTAAILRWLWRSNRTVLNGFRALDLEISKVVQYTALEEAGIPFPRTIAAAGQKGILEAWDRIGGSVITKHNRAGKGLGVRLFHDRNALQEYVVGNEFELSVDGITLVQEYIQAPEPYIIRVELIGREFFYAVRVDTSEGFELCPADACELEISTCSFDNETNLGQSEKFEILSNFNPPFVPDLQKVMENNDIHVAGFEYILDKKGNPYYYDINTNTNYNAAAEKRSGMSAMDRLAE